MNSFRLAHLSDLHLGYGTGRAVGASGVNVREEDGYRTFSAVVSDILSTSPPVDAVLVAGDVFHTPHPSVRSVVAAQRQFRRFARAHIPVYILAGNHDSSDIASDIAASRLVDDPDAGVFSGSDLYTVTHLADGLTMHMVSHHAYVSQRETMAKVAPVEGDVNIFTTHGSVIDPLMKMRLHTQQSPREVVIPEQLLDDEEWSYTLLGHIHERGWVGSRDKVSDTSGTKVFYNGSLLRRGFADAPCPLGRGWTLWNIGSDGVFTPTMRTVPQRPQVDFPVIDASTLSGADITDLVVSRLDTVSRGAVEFTAATAPIVRQKLSGVSGPGYALVDQQKIMAHAGFTLTWEMSPTFASPDAPDASGDGTQPGGQWGGSSDMVSAFDEWSPRSGTLQGTDEDIRDSVAKAARDWVKTGQEEVFDGDEQ